MQVPLLDLKQQYQTIKAEVLATTAEIYESQYFILGPHVENLEKEIAAYCHTKYAVGVSSGTDALLIGLMAADIGIDDLVITTPYTFFATGGSIVRVGAKPVFVDIDPKTYNIDPAKLNEVIASFDADKQKRVKAILPVHLYGQCADMEAIKATAAEHGLMVIEDAAQAIGSEYKNRRAGGLGDIGCFSFFPSKNLGAFGDGGIATTNSKALYKKMQILRNHGAEPKYYHKFVGGNFRIDALQAAVVAIKLKYLDGWTAGRQANAARYRDLFKAAGLDARIKLPMEKETRHIYNQFVISVDGKRDALREFLAQADIGCEIYYPVPLHLQDCFADLGYQKGACPQAEYAAEHTLALPIYPELSDAQLEYVVDRIKAFYEH
jgi:dTDP-4-amino-4,6-dideoxygalactose transaminase